MSKVYYDDEWRNEPAEAAAARVRTRGEQQAYIDARFLSGTVTLDQWRRAIDHLSGVQSDGATPLNQR